MQERHFDNSGGQELAQYDGATYALQYRFVRLPGSVDDAFLMLDYVSSGCGSGCAVYVHKDARGSTVSTSDAGGCRYHTLRSMATAFQLSRCVLRKSRVQSCNHLLILFEKSPACHAGGRGFEPRHSRRTSEVANLTERDIILDTDAPYIKIRPSLRREIKTASSIRDIPLVGVALEAMRQYPTGFHRFRDRTEPLSRYLNAGLRDYDLLPTDHHVIYSFRHTFEKRMLEAGLDFEVRCRLMGHATGRPHYGDGGSIAFRRDELMKIAFPYSKELFT